MDVGGEFWLVWLGNNRWLMRCNRIQTWALEEARRRLEAEGILKEPESKA
jgi:hypothetical protein